MSILASDNSNPERFTPVDALITVIRDQFPPIFIQQPYQTTLNEYSQSGSSVYRVTATDQDLVVIISKTLRQFKQIQLSHQ